MNVFNRHYNGAKYLALFGSEKYNANFNSIRYLISLKSDLSYVSQKYRKIKTTIKIMIFLWKTHDYA